MCGRYHHGPVTERYWEELIGFTDFLQHYQPRYNIAPTMPALILRLNGHGQRVVESFHWGLLPFWAKDRKLAHKTFNARSDSLCDKPAFREAFKSRRCLVLATGYYEWQKVGAKQKRTFNIQLTDARPMLFYGLWESWKGPLHEPLSEPLRTFTIITTDANELTLPIHDRMPCIALADPGHLDAWLDPFFHDQGHLQSLLQPFPSNELEAVEVSHYVNNVNHEGPQCLEPLG